MNKRKTRCSANIWHFFEQKHDRWICVRSPWEMSKVRPWEHGYKRARLMLLSLSAPKEQGLDSSPCVILLWCCRQRRFMITHSPTMKEVRITVEEIQEINKLEILVEIYSLICFEFLWMIWAIMVIMELIGCCNATF